MVCDRRKQHKFYLRNETEVLNSVKQIAPKKDSRTSVLFYVIFLGLKLAISVSKIIHA